MNNYCQFCINNHFGANSIIHCNCQCHINSSGNIQTTNDMTCPHCHQRITYGNLNNTIPSGNSNIITAQ